LPIVRRPHRIEEFLILIPACITGPAACSVRKSRHTGASLFWRAG